MPVVNLNADYIANHLRCPEGKKQIEYVHNDRSGLYVLVSRISPNRGTYYLRYKDAAGKTCHRKLGGTEDLSLVQAKARVKKLRSEIIALGADPQAETKQKRNEMTYAEFMEAHYFPYITPRRRCAKKYRELYDNKIKPEFGNTRVNAITRRQVQAFHSGLKEQGFSNAYCNRHLQLIKSSVNVGINIMEVIDIKNPAVGVPLLEEESRERYLDQAELARLMPVLMEAEGHLVVPARIVRFLLATGLRKSECFHCRWEHIDLERKQMSIPASRAKSKQLDSIPLNKAAIQVLKECPRSGSHPFANPATGKPFVSIKKSFKTLMDRAGLEVVTAHVMRHTAASLLINAGYSLYAVQRILRHSSSKVTEKYAHLSTRSLQDASDTISEQLLRAASGEN
jgi:integrase